MSTDVGTSPLKAAVASFVGGMFEWYDFFIYGTAAALVFNQIFFADLSPTMGTIAAFATLAVGYGVRPFGGIVFGHIADRVGRKRSLLLTLLVMGVTTVAIGLLPTYAAIGVTAPVLLLLLRIVQGFGMGGELGVASVFAVEHAPAGRRGFYGAFAYAGPFAGLVLSTGVFAILSLLPTETFVAWAWRIPFLLSVLIVGVALFIRMGVPESREFADIEDRVKETGIPVGVVLRHHLKDLVAVALMCAGPNSIFALVTVFALSYGTSAYGIPRTTMLLVVTVAAGLLFIVTPLWGAFSDQVGRSRPIIYGAVLEGLLLVLFFALLSTAHVALIFLGTMLVLGLGHAVVNGVFPAFFCELFPTEIRTSAVSLGQQLGGVIGGLAPLAAAALVAANGGGWHYLGLYGLGLCALCALATGLSVRRWGPRSGVTHDADAVTGAR
ncbi:MFS transporter [Pseudonocardia sp. NPDC049154]|uniref:MFS transporter n=1 Tax=Pseudonocardia sp. NPDC049154 TaxID=3155501 RepID=UPI0033FF7686